jgi:hypothetical protein
MLLTRKRLKNLLENLRVSIPSIREKQLLEEYGKDFIDDQGYPREFTEQDIYEQIRKLVVDEMWLETGYYKFY